MNARGIPAQSEEKNLEKEYSYTINEMTGEKIPFGQQAKSEPSTTLPPSGASTTSVESDSSASKRTAQKKSE